MRLRQVILNRCEGTQVTDNVVKLFGNSTTVRVSQSKWIKHPLCVEPLTAKWKQ